MSKDIKPLLFRGFLGAMNKRLGAYLLADDELQEATDLEMADGSLSGSADLGAAVSTNSSNASARWINFSGSGSNPSTGTWASAGRWQYSDEVRYAMRDGNKTYTTRQGARPAIIDAAGNVFPLGIPGPENVTYSSSGAGSLTGTFSYGISYKTWDGFESNIQNYPITLTVDTDTITFSSLWPNDTRVSEVTLWRATVTAGVIGIFYRLKVTTDRAVSSLTDDSTATVGTEPLTWAAGGYPGNDGTVVASVYTSDHSPAPPLTRLANRMHAMASGLAVFSGGIVIGAVGNILRWSQNGYPLYWPAYAEEILDRPVEAIMAYTGYAVILTSGGMYTLSGSSDSAMSNRRMETGYPIRSGWGKSAVKIPGGHLHVAREGLVLFDGAQARLISQFKLPRSYFDSLTIYDAGFFNNEYRLFHSSGQLIVDLQDGWERARFSESSTVMRAVTAVDFAAPIIAEPRGNFPGRDLESVAAAITGLPTAQWITPGATTSFSLGQQIQVYNGNDSYELTQIQGFSASQIYGVFANSHAAGATISGGTAIGRRKFGFVADRAGNTARFFLVGGSQPGLTGAESALSTAMVYNTATSSAAWQEAGTMSAARCEFAPVYVGSTLFVYAGTESPGANSAVTTTFAMNQSDFAWTTVAVTGSAGPRRGYAAGYDVTSVSDATQFWVHGGQNGANGILSGFHSYTIATKAWATISAANAPALTEHAMVYVDSAAFSDSQARLFVFGGATTAAVASGTNNVFCYNLSTTTWSNDESSEGTSLSAAQAVGIPKRSRHIWEYDWFSKKIYLHGGVAVDGSGLADLWEFDPAVWAAAGTGSCVAAWVNGAANVVNVNDRYWHGGAFLTPGLSVPGELYLVGGASLDNPYHADMVRVLTDDLANQSNTAGLYVLKNSDGGAIKRLKGGSAQQWTAQTKDILGDEMDAYKWGLEIRADWSGDVNVAVISDGAQAGSMLTLSSATRTQDRYWLPFSIAQSIAASKATNNTTTTVSSVAGANVVTGSYNLIVVRSGTTPPTFTFNWASGTTQSYTNGWPTESFPMSLTGSSAGGTLTITDNGGPPGSNNTYTDAVAVTVTAATPFGKRMSFRFRGATASGAGSGVAGTLYSSKIGLGEEAND